MRGGFPHARRPAAAAGRLQSRRSRSQKHVGLDGRMFRQRSQQPLWGMVDLSVHVVKPPQGIQVFHEADLEQPSKHEYLRLKEYFLYRMFQILGSSAARIS